MAPSNLKSTTLHTLANAFGTIFIGFGINAILRPANALTFFELARPASAADAAAVDALLAVYGVRDIFMGLAIYVASWFGSSRALGWIVVAAAGVAFGDGVVCWRMGAGEWNHWGYAPMVLGVGGLILGE